MNPYSYPINSESTIHTAKPTSSDSEDGSKMIILSSILYNVDFYPITALHMPILNTHKERTSIDLLTDTDPWSNLKVCHISISKCISAII